MHDPKTCEYCGDPEIKKLEDASDFWKAMVDQYGSESYEAITAYRAYEELLGI